MEHGVIDTKLSSEARYEDVELAPKDAFGDSSPAATSSDELPGIVEKKVLRKQDFTIVPLLAGCTFFVFLDRAALGNARLMNFQKDLHLSNQEFFNCLMIIYVGYMSFELPATLSIRVFRPNWVYGGAVVFFGLCALLTSEARSYASVMVLRLLLGFGESVIQTGFVYLSLWYTNKELTTRCAFWFGTTPLAGMFSGLIAYGTQRNLEGKLGKYSWEWYYIIEGCLTIFWGLLVVALLPKVPELVGKRGSWLFRSEAERSMVMQRTIRANNVPDAKPRLDQIWKSLKDPKTWLGGLAIGAAALNIAAFSSFLPTIVHQFGFTPLHTQLMSMIPYACAVVSLPTVSILSDRWQKRMLPMMCCFSLIIVGFIIVLTTTRRDAGMVGCSLIAAASYPCLVMGGSWQMSSHGGFSKRSTPWAVSQLFIQTWSIVATQIYTQPPHFYKGHGTLLGLNAVGMLATFTKYWIMKKSNAKKDQVARDFAARGQQNPDSDKTYEELCDDHPNFRYVL
ncbi:hypothetical protein H2204_013560 [Knufia peltigerae]|uniref:Major facilitator superfamily (MFS) profile domain-containing protein n=1 Tax=Knufia peltigerae TaxID=1002370 RepID=A0AA39CQ04_9EURO|nr:hypothetical protein H2204_013560 [Knufia peltigerae]